MNGPAGVGSPRTGIVLPLFAERPDAALVLAAAAERAGIDGVFCYDHLWPMGRPDRPALAPFPVLAAVASATSRLWVGTLVARIGLVPDHVLVAQFRTLAALAPGRVVAGLGTGDRLSAGENEAYGVPFTPAASRRESLRRVVRTLSAEGIEVWIGGGSAPTAAIAAEEGVTLNLWDAPPGSVARAARRSTVSWAGPSPGPGALAGLVGALGSAGATWVVVAAPVEVEDLAAAAGGGGAPGARPPAVGRPGWRTGPAAGQG